MTFSDARPIRLKRFVDLPNVGDVAGQLIVETLTGRPVQVVQDGPCGAPNLAGLGTIFGRVDRQTVIWGAGSRGKPPTHVPAAVVAVRGPLTRKVLRDHGMAQPDVLGDPGVLMPMVRPLNRSAADRLGVIPHYFDVDAPFVQRARAGGALVINPLQPVDDYLAQLMDCGTVASSSLHGVIFAHAYGIPAAWVRLSNKPNAFKFFDYFASIGVPQRDVERIGPDAPLESAAAAAALAPNPIDPQPLLVALTQAVAMITTADR